MKKAIFYFLVLITPLSLSAQGVSQGDYITVTLNGKVTYTVGEGSNSFKCFRHGKYQGVFSYYLDPKQGWASISSNKIKYTKFSVPKIGAEVYVLKQVPNMKTGKWEHRAVKGILKKYGAGSYDTHKLGIKAEVKDDAGNPSIESFNHYATKNEIAQLGWNLGDPTVPQADLKKIEAEIYTTINQVRRDPAAFSTNIAAYGTADPVVREAVAFLKNIANSSHSFKKLQRKAGMDKAAREHATEYAANSAVGHKGSSTDCANKRDYVGCRLARHGTVTGYTGENIFSGSPQTINGAGVVMALILDHGVPSRGHRAAFFDTYGDNLSTNKENVDKYICNYRAVGVGCVYDKNTNNIACVIDFADNYK